MLPKKKKKDNILRKILREKSYYVEGRKNQDLWRKKVIIYREQKLYYFEDEVLTFQGKVVVFQEFEEEKNQIIISDITRKKIEKGDIILWRNATSTTSVFKIENFFYFIFPSRSSGPCLDRNWM